MRRLMTIMAAAFLMPLIACGDEDPADPTIEASGTYTLRSINGQDLPVTVLQIGADMVEVLDGEIRLNTDHTFSDSTTLRITEGGQVSTDVESLRGTYVQSSTSVTLTPTGGAAYALALSDDVLTQTVGQYVLVYRR
ncbi:MAG TPA: hypothetical protein VHG09_12995 [Longimicrobiales bacterium]|nr:hypothetical protein [Longimicrobiales bacterium]